MTRKTTYVRLCLTIASALVIGGPLAALAGVPDLELSTAWTDADAAASVFVLPDGSGYDFTEAYYFGATSANAAIHLELLDGLSQPIPNYPPADIWLETNLGGLVRCGGGTGADAATDDNGLTFWEDSPEAGGHTEPGLELVQVLINGQALLSGPGLDVQFNSSDIDGNCVVNLTDIALFTQILLNGTYDYAADFVWDGIVNLTDVALMTQGIGSFCP